MIRMPFLLITLTVLFATSAFSQAVFLPSQKSRMAKSAIQKPERNLQENSQQAILVEWSLPGMYVHKGQYNKETYFHATIEGFGHNAEVGKPALPSKVDLYEIPFGTTATITITDADYTEYSGYQVAPAFAPATDRYGDNEPEFFADPATYQSNMFFPSAVAAIEDMQRMQGHQICAVRLTPAQYNPATQTVRIYSRIVFKIVLEQTETEENIRPRKSKILDRNTSNEFLQEQTDAKESGNSANYIIITTPEYRNAADSLALWKEQMGYRTKILAQNGWSASQVKDSLAELYVNSSPTPEYFVIIGDHGSVPGEIHQDPQDGDDFATDLYYACMDGGSDYYPDIAHGRISVSSALQADQVVQKIINYERFPTTQTDIYTKGLNCAQFQDDGGDGYSDRRFALTSEEVRDYLTTEHGYSVERVYAAKSGVTPLRWNNTRYANGASLPAELLAANGFNWNGSSTDIRNAWNGGVSYVLHRDHGYEGGTGWHMPYFTSSSASSLSNGDLLPVVFSINCHTGEFLLNECFAEKLLRHNNGGAVGVFAASYYSYSGYNDALAMGFFDGIYSNPGLVPNFTGTGGIANPSITTHNDILTMGDVLNHGLLRMVQTWGGGPTSLRYQFELFHYFGDPAMRMWTKVPETITATVPASIDCGATVLPISNASCPNATVTLTYKGEVIASTVLSGGSGQLTFSHVMPDPEQATIIFTHENYRPLITKVLIDDNCQTAPISMFQAEATQVCNGGTIAFTDKSLFQPTQYTWSITPATFSFTNGTNQNSSNPQISFTAPGLYAISLHTQNNHGSHDTTYVDFITVSSPVADFYADKQTATVGCSILFTDDLSCFTNSQPYVWNFGADANPATATTPGPHLVSYSSPGNKTVSLTVGAVSETKTNYITIGSGQSVPVTADYENITNWIDSIGGHGWDSYSSGSFFWTVGQGLTGSSSTGPQYDHTLGTNSGTYLYTEASKPASTGDTAILTSPMYDLTSTQYPMLEFWYHMYGSNIQSLIVDIGHNCTWDLNVFAITGEQQIGTTDPWKMAELDLTAYAGQTVQVRFRTVRGTNYYNDIALDDFRIYELEPMVYQSSFAEPTTVSTVHPGQENVLFQQVKINTAGKLTPIHIQSIDFKADANTDFANVSSVSLFASNGSASPLDTVFLVSGTVAPDGEISFDVTYYLGEGANYFWLGATVANSAQVGDTVGFECKQLKINNQTYTPFQNTAGFAVITNSLVIGTELLAGDVPIYPSANYTYSQTIYSAGELPADKGITKISYFWNGLDTWADLVDVYFGTSPQSEFPSTSSWVSLADLTKVYSGTLSVPSAPGWVEIPLDQPYPIYDSHNIVVAVDENSDDYHNSSGRFLASLNTDKQSLIEYSDEANPTPSDPQSGAYIYHRPNTKFEFIDLAPMVLEKIESVPIATEAYFETANTAVYQVKITTTGEANQLELDKLVFSANGTTNIADIVSADVFYTRNSPTFDKNTRYGSTVIPAGSHSLSFAEPIKLLSDTNYFWLTVTLDSDVGQENHIAQFVCDTVLLDGSAATIDDNSIATVQLLSRRLPVRLPWAEGFETATTETYTASQNILDGLPKWSYSQTNTGRLRFSAGSDFYHSGTHSATLDSRVTSSYSTNYLAVNLNIAEYKTATDLELSFNIMQHGEEVEAEDKVWIRGNNSSPWVEVYNTSASATNAGQWYAVEHIDVDSLLALNGQTVSETFQIRFGQYDNSPATGITMSDGITVDDILLTGTLPAPMIIDSVFAYQDNTTETMIGLKNQEILKVGLFTQGALNPLKCQQLLFSTLGSSTAADVERATLYYSPTAVFDDAAIYGTATLHHNGTFQFNDTVILATGENYFWLVYDISSNALFGNVVDAQCLSVTVADSNVVPMNSSPAGNRMIALNTIVPESLKANLLFDSATVALSWNFWSAHAQMFKIYRNGVFIGHTTNQNFTDTLPQFGNYSYTVSALFATNETYKSAPAPVSYQRFVLPWVEDFESVELPLTYTASADTIAGLPEWSFETNSYGRLRLAAGTNYYHGGSHAATLDSRVNNYFSDNNIIATLNLANYKNAQDLTLSFFYMHHGEESDPNDRVWIRGSETDEWIEVYDLYLNKATIGTWKEVSNIDIDTYLSNAGQVPTATFQIRFGQRDNYTSASITNSDGLTFDDICVDGTADKPMEIVAITATQQELQTVNPGTSVEVLTAIVETQGSTNPKTIDNLWFTTNGTSNTADIDSITLLYSGNTNDRFSAVPYGRTVTAVGSDLQFSDSTVLKEGANYFHLVYHVSPHAQNGNLLDATLETANIELATYQPEQSAPMGATVITSDSINVYSFEICAGDSVALNGTYVSQAGSYLDTLQSALGTDSVVLTNIGVYPTYQTVIDTTLCAGIYFNIGDAWYNTAGTFIDTLNTQFGCDSIVILNLDYFTDTARYDTINICYGTAYRNYTASGDYMYSEFARGLCSRQVYLHLTVMPQITGTTTEFICAGENFNGRTQSGLYTDTLVAANGCDSIHTTNLTVYPVYATYDTATICFGDQYKSYIATGNYIDTLSSANGCDSVVFTNLTVLPEIRTVIPQTICEDDSFMGYTTTGTHLDTVLAVNGCDSIIQVELTVLPKRYGYDTITACYGQTVQGYTASGIYIDSLTAENGCDSIYTLHLTILDNNITYDTVSICQGEIYKGYSLPGDYTDVYQAVSGCDSTVYLHLDIHPIIVTEKHSMICSGSDYNGYTQTGHYVDTLQSVFGCDSIVNLYLQVVPSPEVFDTVTVCAGESFNGYDQSGDYIRKGYTANGCDSAYHLHLTVLPEYAFAETITICNGQTYQGYSESGMYTDTAMSTTGCDSIYTLTLAVQESLFVQTSVRIQTGSGYNGHTQSGMYTDTLASITGCDSIVEVSLTVIDSIVTYDTLYYCHAEAIAGGHISGTVANYETTHDGIDSIAYITTVVYDQVVTNNALVLCHGQTYNGSAQEGRYVDTLTNQFGCDSIVITDVTVRSVSVDTSHIDLCDDVQAHLTPHADSIYENGCLVQISMLDISIWPTASHMQSAQICAGESFNGYSETGVYIDSLLTIHGCDSVVQTSLQVAEPIVTNRSVEICAGEVFEEKTASGTYTDTLIASSGCDSISVLSLIVRDTVATQQTIAICQGQTYAGHTQTGMYADTLATFHGCDSLVLTNLTVNPAYFDEQTVSLCSGQNYNGIDQAGIYHDSLTTIYGCDSIIQTEVTIAPAITTQQSVEICAGEQFNGHAKTGLYTDTLTAASGCDSLVLTTLLVREPIIEYQEAEICFGQTYNGKQTTGIYRDTVISSLGCDSITVLSLTVLDQIITTQSETICHGESFAGHELSGTYTDTLLALSGCDSIAILQLTVKEPFATQETLSICAGQTYKGYSETGEFTDSLLSLSGCDSIHTIMLTVLNSYEVFDTVQVCSGEQLNSHSATGLYIDTLTSATGCDSIVHLALTVLPVYETVDSVSLCQGDNYNGYEQTGIYIDSLNASTGCDSIAITHVVVNPTFSSEKHITISEGQVYNGYSVSGTYTDSLLTEHGCDSIMTLYLTVESIATLLAESENSPYQLFPTITDAAVTIVAPQVETDKTDLLLIANSGQVLATQNHVFNDGTEFSFDMATYAAGTYFVALRKNGAIVFMQQIVRK